MTDAERIKALEAELKCLRERLEAVLEFAREGWKFQYAARHPTNLIVSPYVDAVFVFDKGTLESLPEMPAVLRDK